MEKLLTGLPGFSIKKIITYNPPVLEVAYQGEAICPHCNSSNQRIKASFWRKIKSLPQQRQPVVLRVRCHKYHCKDCGRYYNTRMHGVKKWSR